MEALLVEFGVAVAADRVAALADEMLEDPRCHYVFLGGDEQGSVVFAIWDADSAAEVEEGVAAGPPPPARIRRFPLARTMG